MGGNVTGIIKSTQEETRAQKVNLREIGRNEFLNTFRKIFFELDKDFKKKFGEPIWIIKKILIDGMAFNGSTSFIMNPGYSDGEILKYKPQCGDVDITVPEELKEKLWEYLDSMEDKNIIAGCVYKGCNKPTQSSVGDQINSVFCVQFSGGQTVNVQVDFEFTPYENYLPTEWGKFSHSSTFVDAKAGIKAVHHKYLIRALAGGSSVRSDIVIASPKSTYDKITLTKNQRHQTARMLKFSVGRGLRIAYEPMIGNDGKIIIIDQKYVYKEIPSKIATYETDTKKIFKLLFKQQKAHKSDLELFESFVGVVELCKKYLNEKQIKSTHDRYLELLWGIKPMRGQELECGNSDLDFLVKDEGYKNLINELHLENESFKYVQEYYEKYDSRGKKTS